MTRDEDTGSTSRTPEEIDAEVIELAARLGALEEEIGRAILLAVDVRLHRHFGMASSAEYLSHRFGYSPRLATDKVEVAEALAELPSLRAALISGARSWSATRELTRVAQPDTEAEWLRATEGKTVREVEQLVSGRRRGDLPTTERDPLLIVHRSSFQQTSDQYATSKDAILRARRILGPQATDGQCLHLIMENFLAGGRDLAEGPGYQAVVGICADCGKTERPVGGEMLEVSPATRDCALCDGEIIGLASKTLDLDPLEIETPHVGEPLACGAPHVGGPESLTTKVMRDLINRRGLNAVYREAAKALGFTLQTIPPSLRRGVLARDNFRCTVPGCRDHLFIDIHHLQHVEDGGPNHPENLTTLCSAHHHLHHDGYLGIEGSPSTGLIFRTSRGTLYGARPNKVAA